MAVCDSCVMAAQDEVGDDDQDVAVLVALELGADTADHLCDEVETDGEIKCLCACRRR